MRSFRLLVHLLEAAQIGPQPFEGADHDLLLFSGDSYQQLSLKLAVRRAESGSYLLTGSRQRNQRIAIILRVEAPVKYSFSLKLLDQASYRGSIERQLLLQSRMADLALLRQ